MAINKSRDLILKALNVKVLTSDDILETDYPQLAGLLNGLFHEYRSGDMKHLLAIVVDQSGRLKVTSDLGRAGEILIMERAKLSVIRSTGEDDLFGLLPDEEDEDNAT